MRPNGAGEFSGDSRWLWDRIVTYPPVILMQPTLLSRRDFLCTTTTAALAHWAHAAPELQTARTAAASIFAMMGFLSCSSGLYNGPRRPLLYTFSMGYEFLGVRDL